MVERHEAAKEVFGLFLTELQDDLNAGVTKEDAIEMLAQHMVTKPVFDALLGGTQFAEQNAISRSMQLVLDTLKPEQFEEETKKTVRALRGGGIPGETGNFAGGTTENHPEAL